MFINAGGSPLPGSPVPFRSIPSCDRLFCLGQFNRAIAGSIPVNFIGRTGRAPLRVGEKQCDRLFPSGQFHHAIAPSLSANHTTQFSQVKPGIRENSFTLLVTKVIL
ncbi:hypothetical protein [Coleofasciculus chthonoplastes]|uniref:hypothetical protein n=1 Tax=Coleofasciculus chthonoplastes TaxID=64178 RepID=UPI0032F5016B